MVAPTKKNGNGQLTPEAMRSPLLAQLCDMAAEITGIRFSVVYPQKGTWAQARPGDDVLPEFCKLIRSTPQGAKHCKMCHVLMSIAACSGGPTERRCHAGVSVLVTPVTEGEDEALAILSSCTFAPGTSGEGWEETRSRGKKLGLKLRELKKAYDRLPNLSAENRKVIVAMMAAAREAVKEIMERVRLEKELARTSGPRDRPWIQDVLERELRNSPSARALPTPGKDDETEDLAAPLLIRVVTDLVSRRPNMPYSVEDIATAARITPNYFSSLFHRHMGRPFSEFLTNRRMTLAKELLTDPTRNIGEVALEVGYSDPGYFARRFRQEAGVSPRQWRDRVAAS